MATGGAEFIHLGRKPHPDRGAHSTPRPKCDPGPRPPRRRQSRRRDGPVGTGVPSQRRPQGSVSPAEKRIPLCQEPQRSPTISVNPSKISENPNSSEDELQSAWEKILVLSLERRRFKKHFPEKLRKQPEKPSRFSPGLPGEGRQGRPREQARAGRAPQSEASARSGVSGSDADGAPGRACSLPSGKQRPVAWCPPARGSPGTRG